MEISARLNQKNPPERVLIQLEARRLNYHGVILAENFNPDYFNTFQPVQLKK